MTDAAKHFGGLDSLVLNSAYGAKGFIRQSPLQEWRQAFEVNLIGMIPTLQAAFPYLDKSKRGARIILVSSVGSVRAGGGLGAYCATKAALHSFTLSLHTQLKHLPKNSHVGYLFHLLPQTVRREVLSVLSLQNWHLRHKPSRRVLEVTA